MIMGRKNKNASEQDEAKMYSHWSDGFKWSKKAGSGIHLFFLNQRALSVCMWVVNAPLIIHLSDLGR